MIEVLSTCSSGRVLASRPNCRMEGLKLKPCEAVFLRPNEVNVQIGGMVSGGAEGVSSCAWFDGRPLLAF